MIDEVPHRVRKILRPAAAQFRFQFAMAESNFACACSQSSDDATMARQSSAEPIGPLRESSGGAC